MKKKFLVTSIVFLLVFTLAQSAFANQWGIKSSELYSALSKTDAYDDYGSPCTGVKDIAIIGNRYHNTLMLSLNQTLYTFSTAVYQPQHKKVVQLKETDNGFSLIYPKTEEEYTFLLQDGMYVLQEAKIKDFTLTWGDDNRYLAEQNGEKKIYAKPVISLSNFNIDLFPHALKEIEHLNFMHSLLQTGDNVFSYNDFSSLRSPVGTGTAPVYSAPDTSSWRAAKGKAAVGLKGDLYITHTAKGADGTHYLGIKYNVSERTQRFGYVERALVEKDRSEDEYFETAPFISFPLTAQTDTYLTDDPNTSQFEQFQIKKGTLFTCLGLYKDDYAYVRAFVKDKKISDHGQLIHGFVPLSALCVDENNQTAYQKLPDINQKLLGQWEFIAGDSQAEDVILFKEDGTYSGVKFGANTYDTQGTYYITAYDPAYAFYFDTPPYMLYLLDQDGTASIHGLAFDQNGFALSCFESIGNYAPATITLK